MWTDFSSVNFVNLVNVSATIPEIWNFSYGLLFWHARTEYHSVCEVTVV